MDEWPILSLSHYERGCPTFGFIARVGTAEHDALGFFNFAVLVRAGWERLRSRFLTAAACRFGMTSVTYRIWASIVGSMLPPEMMATLSLVLGS
jgi:hypothetical protein